MKYLALILVFIFPFVSFADTINPLVTQTVTYHTPKAGQTYIVWNLNNWKKVPDKKVLA